MQLDLDEAGEAHIAPRREFNSYAPLRRDTLHCFGVDFLSNREVLELFAQFKPKEIEWLDDSSCNVVFGEEGVPTKAIEELKVGDPVDEHWFRAKPLTLQPGAPGKQKRVRVKPVLLQVRPATEADRKDPTHSGHTDSIYYAHVKEQQALAKQAAELRQAKKRQRQSRVPESKAGTPAGGAQPAGEEAAASSSAKAAGDAMAVEAQAGDASSSAKAAGDAMAVEAKAGEAAGEAPGPLSARLGQRGFLDPLLFMRAPSKAAAAEGGGEGGGAGEGDLSAALRRAEAEYASLPGAGAAAQRGRDPARRGSTPGRGRGGTPGRGGQRERTPGRGGQRRDGTPGRGGRPSTPGRPDAAARQQQRGKKRRPVEQEPRAVSEAPAPRRGPKALPAVEEFLAQHKVKCQRLTLHRTFRTIIFNVQNRKKQERVLSAGGGEKAAVGGGEKAAAEADAATTELGKAAEAPKKSKLDAIKDLAPWEQYFKLNAHFARLGHFVHTVAWEADGRRVLAVVPHPHRVDMQVLARAVQRPVSTIKLRKLKDIATESKFPVFVCPPFGHPADASGRQPVLLVDSSVTEFKKPLLFDCGSVGLSIPVSEFLRSTGAACVEGLAQAPKLGAIQQDGAKKVEGPDKGAGQGPPSTRPSTPEPAPEPAPVATPSPRGDDAASPPAAPAMED